MSFSKFLTNWETHSKQISDLVQRDDWTLEKKLEESRRITKELVEEVETLTSIIKEPTENNDD